MAITLGSNIASLRGQRQLAQTSSELGTVFQRLSSGQRINKASDDAAGLSVADSLKAKSRIYNQGIRNLGDGLSLLSIADSAIENLSSIVVRLEELAAQSANGVYTNKQRKALDAEAQALSKEFFRISKTAEFNGKRLLTGEVSAFNLQAGVGTAGVLPVGIGGAIGTGRMHPVSNYTFGSAPNAITTSDFNGDGLLDLASSDTGGSIFVALGTAGGISAPVSYNLGGNIYSVTAGDLTGEGIIDLVAVDGISNTVKVMRGLGDGRFALMGTHSVGTTPSSVVIGDFNADGLQDLATADFNSDTTSVLLGTGAGSFAARVSFNLGDGGNSLTTADFNGDGILDLASADINASTASVLLGLGNGQFSPRVAFTVGSGPYGITAGDLNGDGVVDLVSADRYSNSVSVLLGVGNGTFKARVSYSVGEEPFGITTGDLNGDGFLDVITSDEYSGTVSVLLGAGNGTFAPSVSYVVGGAPVSVITSDFNRDGVVDVIGANGTAAFVLLGDTQQGVAPLLPFSLKTLADARQALPVFQRKRDQLAAQRGEIGAYQARIDVARNLLEVSSENFKAAESRIRDSDIADESSRLVRLNILQQAAASVLAQANQQPALALQLLR